jgi:hypothetical protein
MADNAEIRGVRAQRWPRAWGPRPRWADNNVALKDAKLGMPSELRRHLESRHARVLVDVEVGWLLKAEPDVYLACLTRYVDPQLLDERM